MVNFATIAFALAATFAAAAPLEERAVVDAPYTVSAATVQKAILCPNGIAKKAGGVVLLVHGTGSTGNESWSGGPYVKALPNAGKGYDVCWVDLPGRSIGDAQISAEYVARAVNILAPQSKTGKVSILGHSQGGGVNPQWALIFWPSIQRLVQQYIALAGDFRGTAGGLLLCNPITSSCVPSVWQQTTGSNYMRAQNSMLAGGGGRALVPTTSIYTTTDEVVTPQFPRLIASSNLAGAAVYALQDLNYCGPRISDHFLIIVDPAAYGLVKATLERGSPLPDLSTFDRGFCLVNKDAPGLVFKGVPGFIEAVVNDVLAITTSAQVPKEPLLMPYVCARGFAPAGSCRA